MATDVGDAGLSASLTAGSAAPVPEAAQARSEAFQAMRERLAAAETDLGARRDIARAEEILMRRTGRSQPEACHRLRKLSMDRGWRRQRGVSPLRSQPSPRRPIAERGHE